MSAHKVELDLLQRDATPAVCSAFSNLTTVRNLVVGRGALESYPMALPQALRQLTNLIDLEIAYTTGGEVHLPTSLQTLTLLGALGEQAQLDLQHLVRLTSLSSQLSWWDNAPAVIATALLPLSLQKLTVWGSIRVGIGATAVRDLVLFASKPGDFGLLQDVSSSLHALTLTVHTGACVEEKQAAHTLGGSSNLTRLELRFASGPSEDWCQQVAQLQGLRRLSFEQSSTTASEQSWLQLTALTRLHTLAMEGSQVDDFVAVVLLNSITGLESLSLACTELKSMAMFGCLTRLTRLTSLCLSKWGAGTHIKDAHLLALRSLHSLRVLQLMPQVQRRIGMKLCSEAAVCQLRAALPHLTFVTCG